MTTATPGGVFAAGGSGKDVEAGRDKKVPTSFGWSQSAASDPRRSAETSGYGDPGGGSGAAVSKNSEKHMTTSSRATATLLQTGGYHPRPSAVRVPARREPRTLHLGSLPPGVLQEDLEAFMKTNFKPDYVDGRLLEGVFRPTGGARAFVAFTSHEGASEAKDRLQDFDWDGHVLHAEWARRE